MLKEKNDIFIASHVSYIALSAGNLWPCLNYPWGGKKNRPTVKELGIIA